MTHQLGDQVDTQHYDQRVDIGILGRGCAFPGQTEYVFGHGGIQLMLYHPETRNDQDQDDQPAVRTYF